eukprot:CAMPEP_0197862744 /NCGR_PEP_ID=MMETSP1438-20131217/39735_1 /TAXON_ID=1461541 /ORGANISM="Pterosperma sp., Strain CCMP1384" /LENGTH=78 /DNA_ID=CAMNT_0043480407 /DNA_START=318 /DNA_END=555 /DNA_ORIENTATION=+
MIHELPAIGHAYATLVLIAHAYGLDSCVDFCYDGANQWHLSNSSADYGAFEGPHPYHADHVHPLPTAAAAPSPGAVPL